MSEAGDRIRQLVLDAEPYSHNGEPYLASIFAAHDVQAVSRVLVEMLRSGDRRLIWEASSFTVQTAIRHAAPAFEAYLPKSGIFETLRDLLYAPDCEARSHAATAIGRLYRTQYVPFLLDAVPTYIERYPLELDRLLLELTWLSRRHRRRAWEHYERIAESSHYVVRWSLLEVLHHEDHRTDPRDPGARRLDAMYVMLAGDESILVRGEAQYALAQLRLRRELPNLLRADRSRRSLRLQKSAPRLTFRTFTQVTGNYLRAIGLADYDLDLLDHLAQFQFHRPIRPPFDYAQYAAAFERWRQRSVLKVAGGD